MVNTPTITPSEAIDVIDQLWDSNMAYFLWGRPGIGKTSLANALAKRRKAKIIVEVAATRIASDYTGLPYIDHVSGTTRYLRPEFLPIEDGPGLILLDELAGADEQTRTALYGLLLERKIGTYTLPDGWIVIGASNRPEDNAISCDLGTAMADRLIHLQIDCTSNDWLSWAVNNGIHPAVCAFIQVKPERLAATPEQSASGAIVLPSPRSWERVSNVLKLGTTAKRVSTSAQYAVAGIIGQDVAAEFFAIAEDILKLPKIDDVLAAAGTKKMEKLLPQSIDTMHALCYSLAASLNEHNVSTVFAVVNDIATMTNGVLPRGELAAFAGQLACERVNHLGLEVGEDPHFVSYSERVAA